MISVVPVRNGAASVGGGEAIDEADGNGILIGSGTEQAARALNGSGRTLELWETPSFRPDAWARALKRAVSDYRIVLVPGGRDGRDLAPRLAFELSRPLLTGVVEANRERIRAVRLDGRAADVYEPSHPVAAVFEPGSRGVLFNPSAPAEITSTPFPAALQSADPEFLGDLPPDVQTMHLAEAQMVAAAGAGLGGEEGIRLAERLAEKLGAGLGATRVVVDRGWLPHDRQIGTTGVMIDPDVYLAFGISGAVQHITGIGRPRLVISVNTDPGCPMMERADLAVVGDARAVLSALLRS